MTKGSESHWAQLESDQISEGLRAKIRCESGFEVEGVIVQEDQEKTLVRDVSGHLFSGERIL